MSRHGTDTNPAEAIRRAAVMVLRQTGGMANMVKISRKVRLPRAARATLRRFGISIQLVGLTVLLFACADAPEVKQEDELIKPQPATCAYLTAASDRQVGACLQMCPDRDEACAKESCFNGDIRRWKEARSRCQPEYSTLYYPNPKFPPTSILVE